MRKSILCAAIVSAILPAASAFAADQLQFGPSEDWVVPVASPSAPVTDGDSGFTYLLDNQQVRLDKGKRRFFIESVYRINSPQGLDNGNITVNWDPATESVVVHRLEIRRGDKLIDVLKAGQTFTTMRRETNLEAGMLDGQLTATLLPEGLQVGDVVDLAMTYTRADPVTKDSVEVELASFNGSPMARGFARLSWPTSLPLTFKTTGDLAPAKITRKDGISVIQYDLQNLEPMVLPNNAPGRFRVARGIEASSFANWGEIANLMKPYFDAASVVPASGSLRDAVERIRGLPGGDRVHAEAALKLVEDQIRYVALNMGTGGYVPASAETTWTRRFGDCKAKTALLLGILRELHIESEPVLANTGGADGLDKYQPTLGWFNHVLVRAHVDGKSYWLDGTRSGDLSLERIQTPDFDWGLPLLPDAPLVRMIPELPRQPLIDLNLAIDAREGINLPAPSVVTYRFRGDLGRRTNLAISAKPPSQRDRFLRDFFKSVAGEWKSSIISLDPDSVTSSFDPATGDITLSLTGKAKLDWSDSNLFVQFSTLAFKPNFERTEGFNREAPVAIDYPNYTKLVESIRLPSAFQRQKVSIPDIDETVAGIEYHRHAGFSGDAFVVENSERAMASEIPYADAIKASGRLRELSDKQLSIYVPSDYRPSDKEVEARMAESLTTASQFTERGSIMLDRARYDDAVRDFSSAIALDKSKAVTFADRGIAYIWKGDRARGLADLDSAQALDPKDPVLLRGRGLIAEQDSKWSEAIDAYAASLVADPGNSFALGHRAIALARQNRDEEALADASAALQKNSTWTEIRTLRDAIYLKRHQCDPVIGDAQLLVDTDGQDQNSLVTAARLYALCHRRSESLATFDKALAIKPAALIYINRADSRSGDDFAGRLADVDAALKLEPKEASWIAFKADEVDRQGHRADALLLYEQALKLEPDNFGIAVKHAILLDRLGRGDEAAKLLTTLRTRAKDAGQLNSLCWEKATAGVLLESALEDCNQALKLKPDTASILDSLAMTLLRLGRYDEAIKAYDKAIAGGTGAISLMGRAIAHEHKGEKALADSDRRAALVDDPEIADRAKRYGLQF